MTEETQEPTQDATDATLEPQETEEVSEVQEKPKRAPKSADVPDSIRAEAGDSYISIARRYFPDRALAVIAAELVTINRNRPVREGVRVILKETK